MQPYQELGGKKEQVTIDELDQLYSFYNHDVINSHFDAVKDSFRLYAQTCFLAQKPDITVMCTRAQSHAEDSLEGSMLNQMWQLAQYWALENPPKK